MSRLSLEEAVAAPLQTGNQTDYGPCPRAVVVEEELFYYRRSEAYRDWIEVFTHQGRSLGQFRTLAQFQAEVRSAARSGSRNPRNAAARALLRQTRPLVGHRIVAVEVVEEQGNLLPFTLFILDDGRQLILQSDPEGNDRGFPQVVKPSPEGEG
jgi:hypothetical protein